MQMQMNKMYTRVPSAWTINGSPYDVSIDDDDDINLIIARAVAIWWNDTFEEILMNKCCCNIVR